MKKKFLLVNYSSPKIFSNLGNRTILDWYLNSLFNLTFHITIFHYSRNTKNEKKRGENETNILSSNRHELLKIDFYAYDNSNPIQSNRLTYSDNSKPVNCTYTQYEFWRKYRIFSLLLRQNVKIQQFFFPFTFWLLDREIARSMNWKWHSFTMRANEYIRSEFSYKISLIK